MNGMNLNEWASESAYFGVIISLGLYYIFAMCKKKIKSPLWNPLLLTFLTIILILKSTGITYETFQKSANKVSIFLTPATICFALPLYRQFQVLKKNVAAVLLGVAAGCVGHFVTILGLSFVFGLSSELSHSLLAKSVTTAIALGITNELGGITGITVIGVCVAGISGNVFGKILAKLVGIKEPIAQGLAMGTSSHAMGTSSFTGNPEEEVQLAMSSLAIVVAGLLSAVLIPIAMSFIH